MVSRRQGTEGFETRANTWPLETRSSREPLRQQRHGISQLVQKWHYCGKAFEGVMHCKGANVRSTQL
jgi:hypothetical protein